MRACCILVDAGLLTKEPVMMLSKYASEEGKAAAEQLTKWLNENRVLAW